MTEGDFMSKARNGFTIVEMLVVIVIIAILAAVTMVAYGQIKFETQEISVKHDMRNMAKQIGVFEVDNGHYPSITEFQDMGIHVNKQTYGVNPVGATIFYCVDDAGTEFSVVARVKSSLILKYLSSDNGVSNYSGSGTAPQLCIDSGLTGPSTNVNYTGFTTSGNWNSWVLD